MMLDLYTLKDLPAHLVFKEEVADLDLQIYGVKYRSKARVEIDVIKSDAVYYCSGHVKLDVDFECSRCLEYYKDSLAGEIAFSIRESMDSEAFDRNEIPESQIIVPDGIKRVDISDPVREALILEIPLKPLCSEECRGLCPQCGVNRNEQDCQCRIEATDTRWDGLRELL